LAVKSGDKKMEIKYVVALGGCQTENQHNNLPKTHGFDGGGKGEEVQLAVSAGEARFNRFGGNQVGVS
jgi:hypothetical protein